ncbi:MAG: hypothetical protein BWZ10_02526 [candidate division BRC1 bacterium ADurb.BinA364]|nr:MAG: hypothetical protein BWZ10_02526 [candidate division BRC1 bacterium ADurb.BinA364]
MRSLAAALEGYYVDWSSYPPHTLDPAESALGEWGAAHGVPSVRITDPQGSALGLTSPIAYITAYPADPNLSEGQTVGYYAPKNGGWVLFSVGPDGDYDLNWELYDPAASQPSPELSPYIFDPTNGTKSSGDIVRFQQ